MKASQLTIADGCVSFGNARMPLMLNIMSPSTDFKSTWFKKAHFREMTMPVWSLESLLKCADLTGVKSHIVEDNYEHIGGISRHAFTEGEGQEIIERAMHRLDAKKLIQMIQGTVPPEDPSVIHTLVHIVVPIVDGKYQYLDRRNRNYVIASEYVSKLVANILYRQSASDLFNLMTELRGVSVAAAFRGAVFESYLIGRLESGCSLKGRRLGTTSTTTLTVSPGQGVQIQRKDLSDAPDKVSQPTMVRLAPGTQTIDAMVLDPNKKLCAGIQSTVAIQHTLYHDSAIRILDYFDKLKICPRGCDYPVYFVVPADIYDQFDKKAQKFVTAKGQDVSGKNKKRDRIQQFVVCIDESSSSK